VSSKLHVAVLMGGWSAEREVSLSSGAGVADALEGLGHKVTRIDMDRNLAQVLEAVRPDVVFNALHGTPGEDGTVQGLMDLMQVKYTHSGLTTSVIAIDKELTKQHLVPRGNPHAGRARSSEAKRCYERDPMARPYVSEAGQRGFLGRRRDRHGGGQLRQPDRRDVAGPWQDFDELLPSHSSRDTN
jgi:D-alanine-D-alanine ligase